MGFQPLRGYGTASRLVAVPIDLVDVQEVAQVGVCLCREVHRGLSSLILGTEQDFGSAQFIGHDLEVRGCGCASGEFHGATVVDGFLHRETIVVTDCPSHEGQRSQPRQYSGMAHEIILLSVPRCR